uniref:Uncharacterized protein n=1 Tax=Anguilla anguilla TaxID=7936 RepID=A0A0E9R531_ANGAN
MKQTHYIGTVAYTLMFNASRNATLHLCIHKVNYSKGLSCSGCWQAPFTIAHLVWFTQHLSKQASEDFNIPLQ